MAPTYGEYLRLEELLALQQGHDGSPSSDELHFIIVHQNFELWFKLVISELRAARDILDCDYVAETLTPLERSTAKMSMSCVVPFTGS